MTLNRLILKINTNKLIYKNLCILNNSVVNTPTFSQQQNEFLQNNKKFNAPNLRFYSETAKNNETKLHLDEIENNLNNNILTRQAKYKQANAIFLTEVEKKPVNKTYNALFDPYVKLLRWNNLAPVHLVYWPSAWAIIGSAAYLHTTPDFYLLGLFALGAISMRSAGCIVNDIWDRNIDKQVERTKDRPLASGKVGLTTATALLAANLGISLSVLLQLNLTTQVLGACALFPVAIYPAAKRFTDWPQAVLGVTFNWGALMGWSAVVCSSSAIEAQNLSIFLPALALYSACINWTLFYDTIYAFQDKEHDQKMGLRSTAILLEKNTKLWLLGFSTLCTSNLALFGWLTSQEPIFYITVGAAMLHLMKQLALVDFKSPQSCMNQFKSNKVIGYLIAFGLLASIYIK